MNAPSKNENICWQKDVYNVHSSFIHNSQTTYMCICDGWGINWQETRENDMGKWNILAGCSGSHLLSQHFGRPRQANHWGQEFKTSLANMVKPNLYWKYKISWVWHHMPVVLATEEAEAGELLEPGRWRLQWAEITPLYCNLSNSKKLPQKKKKVWASCCEGHNGRGS